MNIEGMMGVINIGLKVLSRHILCYVALLMTFGVFCWALWAGTWVSLAAAGTFGGIIFLPVLCRSIRPGRDDGQSTE